MHQKSNSAAGSKVTELVAVAHEQSSVLGGFGGFLLSGFFWFVFFLCVCVCFLLFVWFLVLWGFFNIEAYFSTQNITYRIYQIRSILKFSK